MAPAHEHPLDTVAALADRAEGLLEAVGEQRRAVVGVVGAPGSGKSFVAQLLADELCARGLATAVVPMDGFHLPNAELARLGRTDRKGAPDTFDGASYVALLRRLRGDRGVAGSAPAYDRSVEEAVPDAVRVSPETSIVLTEGNYLLLQQDPWRALRPLFDLTCAVLVDPDLRRERLLARHVSWGRTPQDAAAWLERVDEPNALLVQDTLPLADVAIRLP